MRDIYFELDADKAGVHFHEDMEICYALSGRTGIMMAGRNMLLQPEDFIVLNPLEYHDIYREEGAHTLSVFFSMSLVQKSGVGTISFCTAEQYSQSEYVNLIRGKLAVIYKNYLEYGEKRTAYILSEAYAVLALLEEQYAVKESSPWDGNRKGLTAMQMRQILAELHANYRGKITLETLAEKNYVSSAYLSRQFERYLGMHFSEYLNKLRLGQAEQLLLKTDLSVAEISENCGYGNPNTFIMRFKELHEITPGEWRKRERKSDREKQYEGTSACKTEDVEAYNLNLLKYSERGELAEPLNKRRAGSVVLHENVQLDKEKLDRAVYSCVNLGVAETFFFKGVADSLRQSITEIGFSYVSVMGIFDDNLSVYHRKANGKVWYQFSLLDLVIDEICKNGARPWLDFGRVPEKLGRDTGNEFLGAVMSLPADLNQWGELVEVTLRHYKEKYGEEINEWRFSVYPALYTAYGLFHITEWLAFYKRTYDAIRSVVPKAVVAGGTFDPGLFEINGDGELRQFIQFCQKNGCMPDELSLQCFSIDYAGLSLREVEKRIIDDGERSGYEPVPPDKSGNRIGKNIRHVRQVLKEVGAGMLPICVLYWNSSMWQNELGNDTTYKSSYIVKTILDNIEHVTYMNYALLMDVNVRNEEYDGMYEGAGGLLLRNGIPKAAYQAYRFLTKQEEILIDKGEGYCVTSNPERTRICMILYHYCHHNFKEHLSRKLSVKEQMTIDRYFYYEDAGVKNFQIHLSGLQEGRYRIERSEINRQYGSSYDVWRRMGAPAHLSDYQIRMLKEMSNPGYQYTEQSVTEENTLSVMENLDSHEVKLILISLIE